jgi:hypothetical protein
MTLNKKNEKGFVDQNNETPIDLNPHEKRCFI